MDERLLREFLAEAEDLIEELYGDVAGLRERRAEGPARRELVARTFRHSSNPSIPGSPISGCTPSRVASPQ